MPRDIVITLPAAVEWVDYQKELDAVADWSGVLRFKVPSIPTQPIVTGRCYLVWRGQVRGWMKIVRTYFGEFTCDTTGKKWDGKFIERSGPFHALMKPIPMRGFQGFRYWNAEQTPSPGPFPMNGEGECGAEIAGRSRPATTNQNGKSE